MIRLSDYLTESTKSGMVVESVGSEKLLNAIRNKNGKIMGAFTRIGHEMQWDKITDDDIEEMSTEEARKLAYKRNSNDYIIWISGDGSFYGRTLGNYNVYSPWNYEIRTVRAMSLSSDKAYVITDPERFDTRELRKERAEAKKGAIALMDAASIARSNMKRYKSILEERRLKEINLGDVVETVKTLTEKYAKTISDVASGMVSSDYREAVKMIEDMEGAYHSIMSVFENVIGRFESYEDYKKYNNADMTSYARKEILEQTDILQKLIDIFNIKYIDDKQ